MTTLCVGDSHVNRLSSYIGTRLPSSSVFDITGLSDVKFYGISGGLISSDRHLSLITAAVRQHQPRYVIVCLGGNDLDSSDPDWSIEVILIGRSLRLVTFLTQLKNLFNLQKVTVLSYFPRERTRYIALDEYRRRTICANRFLHDACVQHHISFWKLRGFTYSQNQILSDGVHLNRLGFYKLQRQLRGILLLQ